MRRASHTSKRFSPTKLSPTAWLKSTLKMANILKKDNKASSEAQSATATSIENTETDVLSELVRYINRSIKYVKEHGEDTFSRFDTRVIYEQVYQNLLKKYKNEYTPKCQRIIRAWMGTAGQKRGQGESYTIRSALYFEDNVNHERAKKDFQELDSCAHTIDLGQTLLFRGLSNEFEYGSIEKLTATTLSLGVTRYYNGPLVILYVPKQKVHGLVVNAFGKYSKGDEQDSEVLLISPHVKRLEDEETIEKLKTVRTSQSQKHDDLKDLLNRDIIMYEYLGYFPVGNEEVTGLERYDDDYFRREEEVPQFSMLDSFFYVSYDRGQHDESVKSKRAS